MKIQELILYSQNIETQRQFYTLVLGLECIVDTPNTITFQLRQSILTFKYKSVAHPAHFAFNIPSNAIYDALRWIGKRVELLDCEGHVIADFKKWNAKSLYFYDADYNIVEFISHDANAIEIDGSFSSSDILSVSEIGLPTTNIKTIYKQLNAIRPISIFDGSFHRFCAIGNYNGLFIVVDKHKKKWYPSMELVKDTEFVIKGDYNFEFCNGEIKEISVI
ncbi:MAG: VOC family protein [Flavobacteriaceae bacterium]|nr:VOC family protein [Flavobacteriaceae bacterium]